MKKRIAWIDIAKAFGIWFVVYNHFDPHWGQADVQFVLASFHMPLFFILSGVTMSDGPLGITDQLRYTAKRFLAVMVPYALWALIFANGITLHNLKLIAYASNLSLFWCGSQAVLWFLPAMLICNVLSRLIVANLQRGRLAKPVARRVTAAVAAAVCLLGGLALTRQRPTYGWPWEFNVALVGTAFSLVGYLLRDVGAVERARQARAPVQLLLFTVLACATILLARANREVLGNSYGRVVIVRGYFGNPALFFLTGIIGTAAVSVLAMLVDRLRFIRVPLSSIGKETIIILAVHNTLRVVAQNLAGGIQGNLWFSFVLSLAVLLVSWAIALVLRRIAPSFASGNVALVDAVKRKPDRPDGSEADAARTAGQSA